jgi:predicted DNA-binding protein (MmcQ/YjbR family)
MKYAWLDEYCLSKKGVVKDYKLEWNATRYMIKDKMFVLQGGDKEGIPIITVKLEPAFGEFLRQQYTDIIPGYHMNKIHWNSLYTNGDVPDDVVRDMLDQSYNIVLASLSSKLQKEILENP